MPEATLLGILLSPLTTSITRLHLRSVDGAPLPGAVAASRLAAAMPHLSSLHLEGGAAMAMEAQAAAATSVLLRSLGSNLRTLRLDLHLDIDLLPTPTPTPPQHRRPGTALVLLPADLATSCPALLELRIQLHTRDLGGSQKQQQQQQQQALMPGAAAIVATTAACFASAISTTIASLASLACLELRFPGLALRPDVAAAALPGLAALTRLTKLVLPIRAADPDADASGAPPKSSHVVYGGAVQALLRRLRQRCHCRTPPAPPPTASQQLVELDLGPDLALTLPYLPYTAPALARLSVGELSVECVSVRQWDVVPEPPPPLPLELLSAVPAELWEPTRNAGRGGAAGGGGGGESEGGRPRCSLPLSAVCLPPRLQALQVRYMPDVAILAALAALPGFAHLDCTAVRHPQGEICLDLASVGVPGPPDLSGYVGGGAAATAVSCLRRMVAAAAGLLVRMLDESDWRRHPLTLRPSPFSFLRDSYSRLRWSGPHAAWMAAVAPLAGRVTRLRLKQMALQREDVLALAAALPGLESLELVRCAVRRSDLQAWWAALGPGVLEAGGADLPPGGPGDCDDMFGSSSSSDSSSSNGSSAGSEGSSGCGSDGRADDVWAVF